MLQFTVKMPADLEPDPSTAIANSSTSAAPSFTVDAAAVGELVKESVQSDAVASALNVSAGALSVTTIGAPTQDVSTEGDCPAGKYVAGGVGECTSCAPGAGEGSRSESESDRVCRRGRATKPRSGITASTEAVLVDLKLRFFGSWRRNQFRFAHLAELARVHVWTPPVHRAASVERDL